MQISKDLTNRRMLDELTGLEGNPNQGNVTLIAHSLRRWGQRKPIVVDEDGVILAGNHTAQAARQLGATEIAVTVAAGLLQHERKAYALMDNRTAAVSATDDKALNEMLEELAMSDPDLVADAGYEDWNETVPAVTSWADNPTEIETVTTEHECPQCGFEW